jgi:hypothetical protein
MKKPGGVAQGIGLEFKPQYKERKKKERKGASYVGCTYCLDGGR